METISSNGFSFDTQVIDAASWLERTEPTLYMNVLISFPELTEIVWEGSWLDNEAMNVDPDWSSWLCEALESTGTIYWFEGEPFGDVTGDFAVLDYDAPFDEDAKRERSEANGPTRI